MGRIDIREPEDQQPLAASSAGSSALTHAHTHADARTQRCVCLPGPRTVKHIVFNELCERFCFYGARAILTLYFVDRLGVDEPTSVSLYSWFMAACYVTPLLGGYIADVYWGKYKTILAFNAIYMSGLLILGTTAFINSRIGCAVGLVLIALGTGGIKPNISPFGVDNLANASEQDRTSFFFYFYFAVNLGSAFSYVITPVVRVHAGYQWAFLLSFFMLALSVVVLVAAHRHYVFVPPFGSSVYNSVLRVVRAACTGRSQRMHDDPARPLKESQPLMDASGSAAYDSEEASAIVPVQTGAGKFAEVALDDAGARATSSVPESMKPSSPKVHDNESSCIDRAKGLVEDSEFYGVRSVFRLIPVFIMLPAFWALFDSQGSIWTLQRKHTDNCIGEPNSKWRQCLSPEQLGALNPVFVLILVPIYDKLIFPALRRTPCKWLHPTPLRRMSVGMQLAAVAFFLTAMVQHKIDHAPDGTVSAFWQIPQIIVITASELLVSTTGLEFVYSQAPPSMKGSLIAMFYLAVSLGDVLTGVVYSGLSNVLTSFQLILLLAGLMVVAGIIFSIIAWRYKPVPGTETK